MTALARGKDRLGAGEHARAVGLERIERAGGREAFDHALVDGARRHPGGEIGQRGEKAVLAGFDDQLDRLRAHPFQRGQRITDDACRSTSKVAPERLIDGASTLMPSRWASARNSESLSVLLISSVIDAARNSTGIMRLHVRGLIGRRAHRPPHGSC